MEHQPQLAAIRNLNSSSLLKETVTCLMKKEDPPNCHRVPNPQPQGRDPLNWNRVRDNNPQRQIMYEVKITPPTFTGYVDPEAYLDWERTMEYIFECYGYTDPKR